MGERGHRPGRGKTWTVDDFRVNLTSQTRIALILLNEIDFLSH